VYYFFSFQHLSVDQSSVEEFTATIPRLIDSASIIKDSTTDFEVPCSCQQQLTPLIHGNEVHFVVQASGRRGTKNSQGYIESYSLFDGGKEKKTFSNHKKYVSPSMIFYLNKITILGANSDVGSRALYQLNSRSNSSWECVLNSKCSSLQLELKKSLCISYDNEKVVVVNALNQLIQKDFSVSLVIYFFSSSTTAEKYWRSVNIALSNVQSPDGRKYEIQSGVIFQNSLYCSLLLPGTKTMVCKVDMATLQQHVATCEISKSWSLLDSLLLDCFLAVFDGEIVAITFKNVNNKSIMEVRRCSQSFVSSLEYHYEFPSVVKVVTASVLSENVIVVYHDCKADKCLVKKLNIYQ